MEATNTTLSNASSQLQASDVCAVAAADAASATAAGVWALEALLAAVLAPQMLLALGLLATALVLQPWSGRPGRSYAFVYKAPWPIFYGLTWLYATLEQLITLMLPPPLRLARMALAFAESQVLMALVALGIPDLLRQQGPQTASQLAEASGCKAPPQWVERLLDTSATLGLVKKAPGKKGRHRKPEALYAPNAMTAALYEGEGGDGVPNMVEMCRVMPYAAHGRLSEGLKTGKVPFQLANDGKAPWQTLEDNPAGAHAFDAAMAECSSIVGNAVVNDYDWGRFDQVVDVGGGVGELTAELLQAYPKLRGVVVDQEAQIKRAKVWWEAKHRELLPRVTFVTGDFFNPSTLPAPAPNGKTVYMLRNILHDWNDEDAVRILTALRKRVSSQAEDRDAVTLAVVEATACEKPLPQFAKARRMLDMNMMVMFGDAKERDEAGFKELFAKSGWRLQKVVATRGMLFVIEAVPASLPAGQAASPAGD